MQNKNPLLNEEIMQILGFDVNMTEYVFWENVSERRIIINEEINDVLVERVIMQIYKFNSQDKDISPNKRKPIYLFINSVGGDVSIGMVLCDVIKASTTPVIGVCLGFAYSMGTLILLSCHKRYSFKHSSFLIHDGSLGVHGSAKKAKDQMKFLDSMEDKIKNIILSNSKISDEIYQDKSDNGTEWYLWADEALELGIVDKIIENLNEVI